MSNLQLANNLKPHLKTVFSSFQHLIYLKRFEENKKENGTVKQYQTYIYISLKYKIFKIYFQKTFLFLL